MSHAVSAAARNTAPDESETAIYQSHRALMTLGRAADPAHADDLVQDTWDHFLNAPGAPTPTREQLTEYLLELIHRHTEDHEVDDDAWAASLVNHHPHNPADLAETDLPADPASFADLRALADRDGLDADADQAELLFPELYGDRPEDSEWTSPPVAWPSLSRILSPEDEAETSELYSVVDEALEELPATMADAVYLVDIEGHSLPTASGLLGRDIDELQRDLVVARNHLRGRVDAYLTQP
jgi:DNA-directed RNA polymerase specialized sigma24 family protein